MSRCDSAAIVANTSELLPEPETPVNTVSRRFGISTLTSLRLLTRAPWTRIRSWASAGRGAADCASVIVVMVLLAPSLRRPLSAPDGQPSRWRRSDDDPWSIRPAASSLPPGPAGPSAVLEDPEDVAVRVLDRRHEASAADVPDGLVDRRPGGRQLVQLGR